LIGLIKSLPRFSSPAVGTILIMKPKFKLNDEIR